MTREEFIKNIKVQDGTFGGGPLNFNVVQKSVMNAFTNRENFILMSPRQSGRLTSILINILYDLYTNDCQDTIITIPLKANAKQVSFRLEELLTLNPFITGLKLKQGEIKNSYNQKVLIKIPQQVKAMTLRERENKTLIVLDGAFIEDSTPLFNLIQGWHAVILETVPANLDSFNSVFVKGLMDFDGLRMFKIIKHQWEEIFDIDWYERQKIYVPEEFFKREILIEWE